ncbi:MAG: enoyl-CoA hydratase/isomerase family protein [Acidobacteria bacterium]|nr:enoyl-CoA hydratase/isomerase family protein [Acidobacteriota bacterium]
MRFEDAIERMAAHDEGRIVQGRIGGVGVLLFNQPEKHNAITVAMWEGVARILEAFEQDDSIRVVVYAGAGDKAFVSGGDISQFKAVRDNAAADAEFARITGAGRRKLASFAKPSIAFLQGWCLGGGIAIALEADLRVASTTARLGVPAARLGIAYGIEPMTRLVQLVGPSRARLVLYTARRFGAEEALAMGLVDLVFPAERAAEEALALAETIAGNAPLSVAATKATVGQILLPPAERDLDALAEIRRVCMDSADYREGRAAFLEKRAPVFTGR